MTLVSRKPFDVVRSFVESSDYTHFTSKVISSFFPNKIFHQNTLNTDCFFTMCSIATMFSGKEKAEIIVDLLRSIWNIPFSYLLANDTTVTFNIKDLFTGPLVSGPFKDERIRTSITYCERFFEMLNEDVEEHKLSLATVENANSIFQEMISFNRYDFNREVYNQLVNRISLNKENVHSKCSAIYYIGIRSAYKQEQTFFFHALTLEQFYNEDQNGLSYRVYQSSIDAMTLTQFLAKKYDKQNFLDDSELTQFLVDLERITCRTHCDEPLSKIRERCFGTADGLTFPLVYYDSEKREVNGLSLRYIVDLIDPTQIEANISSV